MWISSASPSCHGRTRSVMSRSNKKDERRLPIHPQHIERIDVDLCGSIFLERGYGESFGVPDERLAPLVAGLLPRSRLIADCDAILLTQAVASGPRPTAGRADPVGLVALRAERGDHPAGHRPRLT